MVVAIVIFAVVVCFIGKEEDNSEPFLSLSILLLSYPFRILLMSSIKLSFVLDKYSESSHTTFQYFLLPSHTFSS